MFRIYTIAFKFWGNAQDCYWEPIVKLQKRDVRIISCSLLLAHSEPLLIHLTIFQFKKLYFYTVVLFMYKYEHKLLSSIFKHMYVYNRDVGLHQQIKFLQVYLLAFRP